MVATQGKGREGNGKKMKINEMIINKIKLNIVFRHIVRAYSEDQLFWNTKYAANHIS